VIVRRVGSYGLAHCLRVTVGTADECGMVIEGLSEFMKQARG
jgi:histidinol-phosphate aminotransferase